MNKYQVHLLFVGNVHKKCNDEAMFCLNLEFLMGVTHLVLTYESGYNLKIKEFVLNSIQFCCLVGL